MKDFNYNIKIIKEFEVGEHKLPFLFSLDKIKAFKNDVVMVDSSCVGKYKSDKLSNDYKELSEEERKQKARESITDDYLSSISKAKELSAKVAYQILDRIEKLENPDKVSEEIIKNAQSSNILMKFVEN